MKCKALKNLIFYASFLTACSFNPGGGSSSQGALSSQVAVRPKTYYSDSAVRSRSGNPLIGDRGGLFVCRARPLSLQYVIQALEATEVAESIIDKYFRGDSDEEEAASEAIEQDSSPERVLPVFTEVGNNWIKFGLEIANSTTFPLIVDNITIYAKAKCGVEVFSHTAQINTGYCSENSELPFLYIVPPQSLVVYNPASDNPDVSNASVSTSYNSLTLYFDSFPIIDRRDDPSKKFERLYSNNQQAAQGAGQATAQGAGQECHPRYRLVKPRYTLELSIRGYFLTTEDFNVPFSKRFTWYTASERLFQESL